MASMTGTETIIVGAGPAGLACSAMLGARGHSSLVLEKADSLAASWHGHYDRLHLHTHRMHSGLPGMPMPHSFPKYPSRRQVVEYLESYAQSNALEIKCGEQVTSVQGGKCWTVATQQSVFEAKNVIVATGLAHTPVRASWQGQESFTGKILHSSEFSNAANLAAKRVLVVGFGNSAGEIALECAEAGLFVGLSVRSPVNVIPREMFGLPTISIAIAQQFFPYRLIDAVNAPFLHRRFGDISKFGLVWSQQGPLTTIMEKHRTPLINIGTMERITSGDIGIFSGIASCKDRLVHFTDGAEEIFDAIVMATGYRPALETLLADFETRFGGTSGPARNELHPAGDGLYFCGFNVVPTGHLRQIGKEALKIARSIHAD